MYASSPPNLLVPLTPSSLTSPGPTCKKMNDLRPNAVFRASAFRPTEEELQKATQRRYVAPTRNTPGPSKAAGRKPPPRKMEDFPMELSDSSDDELPDRATLIRNGLSQTQNKPSQSKKKAKDATLSDDVGCTGHTPVDMR